MYLPSHFKEDRVPVLHAAMREIALATLVTSGSAGMEASHVPLLLDPEPKPYGTLVGHIARANPQWRRLQEGTESLAIFLGPERYITPDWYPSKRADGKVVPTWNYVAVHAYGVLKLHHEREWLLDLVSRLTRTHEAPRATPWAVTDAPAEFVDQMLRAIVGFELPIARLEGKWKMSQNRSVEDRGGVLAGLAREDGAEGGDVAAAIRAANNE